MTDSQKVDTYILNFPAEIQARLREVRQIIRQALPEATERISYQMPTFYQTGNVIHFAAWKDHIGLYPGSGTVSQFEHRLQDYTISKGCIRIPFDQPLPEALITEICQFSARENQARVAERKLRNQARDN